MTMKLQDLINSVSVKEVRADISMDISGVYIDSRKVTPGGLFVAVRGFASDGNSYIRSALEKGAACVVTDVRPETDDFPYVLVESDRAAEAVIAANFHGRPADSMKIIGVTGTNGKTTVTNLVKGIIESVTGETVGLIGTNANMIGDTVLPAERTTPDALELHGLFRRMADAGAKYVVMEVSSHALCLNRVEGITFEVGAFTNLTEDHLDFHKTMSEYAAAKALIFRQSKKAVINLDDSWAPTMEAAAKDTGIPVYTFSGEKNEADLTAKDIRLKPDRVSFCALSTGVLEKVRLGIPGMFSVYNGLTALSIAVNLGLDLAASVDALALQSGVKGRAEVVPTDRDFTVLIDYAHTPDALEKILNTVRGFTTGRVIVLFGCGGDRDREKRPIMGEIAARLADYIFVTSDNPRTEDPNDIIAQILPGLEGTKKPVEVIENRREAIGAALRTAKTGDLVLLAGKGHETYQEICGVKHDFDERRVVAEYLSKEVVC